jgi:L-threonylcarbamoyladenylate synthase
MIVKPTAETIAEAAQFLHDGKLIGMPTETVYGIAANALNEGAVRATFEAKGRPSQNPLIVHVASLEQAAQVAREFPARAIALADEFWPGPLTMVLHKSASVPLTVTAGLETVAIRMPDHPVALQLIQESRVPVSAPSANRFMSLSPTSAQMIAPEIASRLAMVLDGGSCHVGIESTVLDLTEDSPRILRPGAISKEQIAAVLKVGMNDEPQAERRSPGMYPKHYAPATPVEIVSRLEPEQAGLILDTSNGPNQIEMPLVAGEYARVLYRSLFDMDQMRVKTIYVQSPPQTSEWNAVWDRLQKIVG